MIHRRVRQPGFTLLELLITLLIIGMLVSFAAPSFMLVREKANTAKSLANIRSIGTMFASYSTDYRDTNPYFTDPQATYTVLRSDVVDLPVRYFDATVYWNYLMASTGYADSVLNQSFMAPGSEVSVTPDYRYAAAFIATQEFWKQETRTGPEQWRSTRSSAVRYPSAKGILRRLVITELGNNEVAGNMLHVAYVDGHAAKTDREACTPGYPRGEGNWVGSTRVTGWVIHHTLDGIFGRDH